jgi:hypothetical protein
MPEVFSRLTAKERSAEYLIKIGYLEKVDVEGVPNSDLLGYRMTRKFMLEVMGRIFSSPDIIFPEEMLKPELQDLEIFRQSVENIVDTQKEYAARFIRDGSVEIACEPIKALIYIMAEGEYHKDDNTTWTRDSEEFRRLFTKEALLSSDWYQRRLDSQVVVDRHLLDRIEAAYDIALYTVDENARAQFTHGKEWINRRRSQIEQVNYIDSLKGRIGVHETMTVSG